MDNVKGALQSVTIWGAVLSVLATVLNMLHIQLLDPAGMANDIVALIGAGIAVYGRVRAVKKIGAVVSAPAADPGQQPPAA